jgi:hypothetical protein
MKTSSVAEGDLLFGRKRIAQHLGVTPRQLAHLIEKGRIPVFKIGASVCCTRSGLRAHFQELLSQNGRARSSVGTSGWD